MLFIILVGRLFYLQIIKNEIYKERLVYATSLTITSTSTPRGRIYDRNYKLLVDNEAIKTIYYKKQDDVTTKDEIELAYRLSDMLNIDYSKLSDNMLKTFWYKNFDIYTALRMSLCCFLCLVFCELC